MRLTRLEISGLYGSLNKDITFNEEINLIVGINGSGKTSVLNVIDWLLRRNLARLSTTKFDRLALAFSHESKNYTIEAVQNKMKLDVNLTVGNVKHNPIKVRLDVDPEHIRDDRVLDALLESYSRLSAEPDEKVSWSLFDSFPNPVVITLDRTLSAEAENEFFSEPSLARTHKQNRLVVRSPLKKVDEVTAARYASYRNKIIELNDVLKGQLVMSALQDPMKSVRTHKSSKKSAEDIEKLESKVIAYLSSAIKGEEVADQIKRYFQSVRVMIRSTSTSKEQKLFLEVFSAQYQQLEALAQAFNEFEKNSESAYSEIKRYLDMVNIFFEDSRKKLTFNEMNNNLGFQFINSKKSPHGPFHGVHNLSSGERQILILFTFLAFIAEEKRVFIVDEPELSLHPKWQEEFLGAFLSLKPKKTQLLMATHSPEIVGVHKSHCVVLQP